jgi:hypothetical protein
LHCPNPEQQRLTRAAGGTPSGYLGSNLKQLRSES